MDRKRVHQNARRFVGSAIAALMVGAVAVLPRANAAPPASYTATNSLVDGPNHCFNGGAGDPVNCNLYDAKNHVWLNAGPTNSTTLPDGTYFFAVLEPSGQSDPNDAGTPVVDQNLSDDKDPYTARKFSVSGGTVTNLGTHDFDPASGKIRLFDYSNTTNGGGVYILAICNLAGGYPAAPSSCKYDAFKIRSAPPGTLQGALSAVKEATGTFTRTFTWNITKEVDKTTVTQAGTKATFNYTATAKRDAGIDSGFTVTGTIDIVNDPAAGTASNVTVTESPSFTPAGPTATCTIYSAPNVAYQNDATLAPGGSLPLTYSCAVTGATAATKGANIANVSWTNPPRSTVPTDSTTTPPAFFDFSAPTLVDDCATITDTDPAVTATGCTSPLDVKYSHEVTGTPGTCVTYDNTATFTTDDTKATGTAKKSVKLCVGADLTVSKTADPAFKRTYLWSIAKAVDKTIVKQSGGSATFNYTVNAAETGFADSSWVVNGTITVANPNDFQTVTLSTLTDAINNGGTCVVTPPASLVVPKSGSITANYTCTYVTAPNPVAGTNTATATWDKMAASTPTGSADGTKAATFGAPTAKVNDKVTITDTFNSLTTTLGTLTATDVIPYASGKYEYARTVPVPANTCTTYPNTAKITETGQTADKSVTVCGAVTGGLTIGFWSNKNGQAIIKGQASSGICPSTAWLRGFSPFQDLSATATCAQVGTYYLSIFGSANASGTSMNAMLKAQMLATALDVYFSDPALGGNKISAPVPLGGVKVDLTQVCKNISTCSIYENTSAVFGGASALTVSQLLAYAASQSTAATPLNPLASPWYGQVKTTQELAKDTFDAINNKVAFAAP
jgi:hypothetical protein